MNQRQLSYFLEVYKRRSISHAAEALYISPQALSKTIAALEQELNISLFTRKSNRIIPTNAAASLATHAKTLLEEYDIIENKLFNNIDIQKTLPISCSYDVPQMMDADFFYQFYTSHPDIFVQLNEYPDDNIIKQLERNQVELAILPGHLDPQKFIMEPLFSDPFCLILSKEHPLAGKDTISFADLKREHFAVKGINSISSESQYNLFLQNGIVPKIVLESSDSHLIYQMVEKNYAVAITLTHLAKEMKSDQITAIPFHDKWIKKTMYLTYKRDYILSHNAIIFKEALLQSYKKN